jgi:type II secretion system protein N
MQRLIVLMVSSLWTLLFMLLGVYFTFPSESATERLQWEVQERSRGSMGIELANLTPWRVGLKAKDVILYSFSKKKSDPDDEPKTLAFLDKARLRVGLLSLLKKKPAFYGSFDLQDGNVDFSGLLTQDEEQLALGEFQLKAKAFPLNSVPPIGGVSFEGEGALNAHVDLQTPEGLRKANGNAEVFSRALVLTAIRMEGSIFDGMEFEPIEISDLILEMNITQGKAEITKGLLQTSMGDIELDGDITLMEPLSRSRLRIKATLNLNEQADLFKPFLKDALWDDEAYHYAISGSANRPRFRPDRKRKPSRNSRKTDRDFKNSLASDDDAMSPEERKLAAEERRSAREERLEDRKERMRKRREDRESSNGGARTPMRPPRSQGQEPNDQDFDDFENNELLEEVDFPPEDNPPGPDFYPEDFDAVPDPNDEEYIEE